MKKIIKVLLVIAMAALFALSAFSCEKKESEIVLNDRFDLTNRVLDFMQETYCDDIDYDVADVYAAYGLVSSLGKYNYINPITDLLGASSDGKGFGLIVRNTKYNEHLIDFILAGSPFLAPYNGQTAQRGDEIYAINGTRLSGLDTASYTAFLSTLPSDRPAIFTLRRGEEKFDVAYSKVDFDFPYCIYLNDLPGVSNDFGYICLRTFDNSTHVEEEFKNAVKAYNADGNRALILDLRGNGGGSSTVFSTVASALIGQVPVGEPLLEIHYAKQNRDTKVYSKATEHIVDTPIYVLCDGQTASASEALIGTMRAHGTLTALIGQNTVGKGVAQNGFITFQEGESGYIVDKGLDENGEEIDLNAYLVQLVVGKYYIYDSTKEGGKYCIHERPFVPDIPVSGDNTISPDYNEDIYIHCAVEHYNGQKNS